MQSNRIFGLVLDRHGRIGRRTFFGSALVAGAAFLVLFVFLDTMVAHAATWILYPPLFWAAFALSAKRLHDSGRSALWLLAVLVPLLGPLTLAWLLLFRKGSAGENQFGADPLAYGDYLTVEIHAPGPAR